MKEKKLQLKEPGDRTVFNLPENYFTDFEAKLEQKLDALERGESILEMEKQKDNNYKRYVLTMESVKPLLYMAAMFVLLIFSIGLIMNFTSGKSSLKLSAENNTQLEKTVPTAEDYLISSVGAYGISEYYVEPETFE